MIEADTVGSGIYVRAGLLIDRRRWPERHMPSYDRGLQLGFSPRNMVSQALQRQGWL